MLFDQVKKLGKNLKEPYKLYDLQWDRHYLCQEVLPLNDEGEPDDKAMEAYGKKYLPPLAQEWRHFQDLDKEHEDRKKQSVIT